MIITPNNIFPTNPNLFLVVFSVSYVSPPVTCTNEINFDIIPSASSKLDV